MLAFKHLSEICKCRDRLVADKVAKQEEERHAEMQSKVLLAIEKQKRMEEFHRKKQEDKEEKQLKHLKWLQECAERKQKKMEELHKTVIAKKKEKMIHSGQEMDENMERLVLIDLECGVSESIILQPDYVPGSVSSEKLEERELRKRENRRRHEELLKMHDEVRLRNEARRQQNKEDMLQRKIAKESKRLAHEAQKAQIKIDQSKPHNFEYVSEYDGLPVFTVESITKAYNNEITNNPILEINDLIKNMFAGYQQDQLEVNVRDNPFSTAGTYVEAKLDTCRTIAYGRQQKEAKRVALQALVLTIKNGGELDDGFVDQMEERGVLKGGDFSTIHKSHPVHQVNVARSYFNQEVKFVLDIEQPRWTMICHFGDLTALGHDETKALAKQRAAEEILPLIVERYGSLEEAKFNSRQRKNRKMGENRKLRKAEAKREQQIAESYNSTSFD